MAQRPESGHSRIKSPICKSKVTREFTISVGDPERNIVRRVRNKHDALDEQDAMSS